MVVHVSKCWCFISGSDVSIPFFLLWYSFVLRTFNILPHSLFFLGRALNFGSHQFSRFFAVSSNHSSFTACAPIFFGLLLLHHSEHCRQCRALNFFSFHDFMKRVIPNLYAVGDVLALPSTLGSVHFKFYFLFMNS